MIQNNSKTQNTRQMLLSFIIPAYNCSETIKRCLLSIYSLNLNEAEFEIIVINDGSTDQTLNILKKIEHEYSNIKIFTQNNCGAGIARNNGVKKASGSYIWFIDSDDYLTCQGIEQIYNLCSLNELDIIAFNLANHNFPNSATIQSENKENIILDGESFILQNTFSASPCCYIFRRVFFINERLFYANERRGCEDIDHTIYAIFKAKKIQYLNISPYTVYPRPNSLSRSFNIRLSISLLSSIKRSLEKFKNEERYKNNYILRFAVGDWLIHVLNIQRIRLAHSSFLTILKFPFLAYRDFKYIKKYLKHTSTHKKQSLYLNIMSTHPIFGLGYLLMLYLYDKVHIYMTKYTNSK